MYTQISLLVIFAIFSIFACETEGGLFIDNFQNNGDVSSWVTQHPPSPGESEGLSISSLVLLKTKSFQRGVLFTMLTPKPKSCAAIAGITKDVTLNASNYSRIAMKIKGQGQYRGYEFVLRHRGVTGPKASSYVKFFKAPAHLGVINLDLEGFALYMKGKRLKDPTPLDKSEITMVGILAYGGQFLERHQSGVASLEIEWIKFE